MTPEEEFAKAFDEMTDSQRAALYELTGLERLR